MCWGTFRLCGIWRGCICSIEARMTGCRALLFCLSPGQTLYWSPWFTGSPCLLLQKVSRVSNKAERSMNIRRSSPTSLLSESCGVWVGCMHVCRMCVWLQMEPPPQFLSLVTSRILINAPKSYFHSLFLPRSFLHSPKPHCPLGLVIFQRKSKNILRYFWFIFPSYSFPKAFYSVPN